MKVSLWGVASLGFICLFLSKAIIIFGEEKTRRNNDTETIETNSDTITSPLTTNADEFAVAEPNETKDPVVGITQSAPLYSAENPQSSERIIPDRTRSHSEYSTRHFSKQGKKILFGVLIALLFLGFIIFRAGFQRGCSKVEHLNIRSEPNGEVIGTVNKGSCFFVNAISQDRTWVRIGGVFSHNKWVSIKYIEGLKVEKLSVAN